MIRPVTPDDTKPLLALSEATGLFGPAELEELTSILADYFDTGGDRIWVTDDDEGLVGVAYCAPEVMTHGTWNLHLIAVHPDRRGQGRGSALLRYIEHLLTEQGERMLLVETSGTEDFERTRSFYRKCGYEEEARIRDFYQTGDDKIVYRKVLTV